MNTPLIVPSYALRAAQDRTLGAGTILPLFACLVCLTTAASALETPAPVGGQATEAIEPVSYAIDPNPSEDRLVGESLELKTVRMDPLHHRGGSYTDAGEGRPGRLTEIEQIQMENARRAVEMSRAAGTLFVTTLPEDTIPATAQDVSEMKLQKLRALRPLTTDSDPAAGIGDFLPRTGPAPAGLPDEIQGDFGPSPQPISELPILSTPKSEEVRHD